jgi:hypothetical protein
MVAHRAIRDGRLPLVIGAPGTLPEDAPPRSRRDVGRAQGAVPRGVPLRCDVGAPGGERVGDRDAVPPAHRAAGFLAEPLGYNRAPDVIRPLRAPPPHRVIRSCCDIGRAQGSVLRRVPFACEMRRARGERVVLRNAGVGAERRSPSHVLPRRASISDLRGSSSYGRGARRSPPSGTRQETRRSRAAEARAKWAPERLLRAGLTGVGVMMLALRYALGPPRASVVEVAGDDERSSVPMR